MKPTTEGATMKPATQETELPPSTLLRKAVFGGFATILHCRHERIRQITIPSCLMLVLVGMLLCGGCASPPQTPPVSPEAPVAQLEFSPHKTYKVDGVSAYLDKVDGVKVWTLKGSMKGAGWRGKWGDYANVFELTPGAHTFEVTFNQGSPLTIELNARAGHNYRLRAHNYDEVTTSLYIEDVSTGEVVSGHRPGKASIL
jgi:hypothetical protein